MLSDLKKQILACCMQVSRGKITKEVYSLYLKENKISNEALLVSEFIEILFYILQLKEKLYDFSKKRGFNCSVEIDKNITKLIEEEAYDIKILSSYLPITIQTLEPNSINFVLTHEVTRPSSQSLTNKIIKKNNYQNKDIKQLMSELSEKEFEQLIQKNIQNKFFSLERNINNIEKKEKKIPIQMDQQAESIGQYETYKEWHKLFENDLSLEALIDCQDDLWEIDNQELSENEVMADKNQVQIDAKKQSIRVREAINAMIDCEDIDFIDETLSKD